jgi:hypothetical protein
MTLLRRASLLALVVFASGCADVLTDVGSGEEARLVLHANVAGSAARTLVVEVTAPDIPTALIFNLAVQDGVASGAITLPAGSDRLLVVRAFDRYGVESHRGGRTIRVRRGANDAVAITLLPLQGDQPIEITVGSYTISVTPGSATLVPGETIQLAASVRDADENLVANAIVQWASLDLSVATTGATGLVTARATGVTQVVAVYAGAAAAVPITVQTP